MDKDIKIRNNDDKTIFELKIESAAEEQEKKLKPSMILGIIFLVIAALAVGILGGYILHKIV